MKSIKFWSNVVDIVLTPWYNLKIISIYLKDIPIMFFHSQAENMRELLFGSKWFLITFPAFPKNCAAIGAGANPPFSIMAVACFSKGFVRSSKWEPREPGCIFSNPKARVQSARPPLINWVACMRAVEPVEQLLLTWNIHHIIYTY